MGIHWYPGHMHKATKEIKAALKHIDVVIEILDARIPYSSSNPVIHDVSVGKKHIKILNKSDLADPEITAQWQAYYESHNIKTLTLSAKNQPDSVLDVHALIKKLCADDVQAVRNIDAMIMGIPNVGKSTIINILAGRQAAATGNEPAVTKAQKRINCDNGIILFDTPGILWPKIHNEKSAYRLAVLGSIKNTAMDYGDVAFFAVEYCLEHYADELKKRFNLDVLPSTEQEFLATIARERGCLSKGGVVNYQRISEIFIHELREAVLGRITLETPNMAVEEIAETELEIARIAEEKEAKKRARKQNYKKRKK